MSKDEITYSPIEPVRLSDGVADQLKELILKGDLEPGAKLPSERDLALRLHVSRTAVRDALRILEGMHLLSVEPGRGTFVVGDVSQVASVSSWIAWLREHKDQVAQIMEVRVCIEARAAELAAERATSADIEAMRQALDLMQACIDRGDTPGAIAADRTFHDQFCTAGGNELLRMLRNTLYLSVQGRTQSLFYYVTDRAPSAVKEHRVVLQAVAAHDPQAAGQAMRRHLQATMEAFLAASDAEALRKTAPPRAVASQEGYE